MTNNRKITIGLASLALAVSAGGGLVAAAHADTTTAPSTASPRTQGRERPTAEGMVTAISGSTITITDKRNGTAYTVDAASATIHKHGAPVQGSVPTAPTTVSVSDIVVGDMLMVRGTLSGTTVTATDIMDGQFGMGHRGEHGSGVTGTVTSVHGTTLTVTGKDGKTYTVDTTGAVVGKITTITAAEIAVGDTVGVEGTVSGTSVSAKHIMDGLPKAK